MPSRAPNPLRMVGINAGIIALALSVSVPTHAIDFSWQPQLRVGSRATDNVLSSVRNQEAALGFDNTGSVILKAEAVDWRSSITPSFNIRRFAIGDRLDAEEYGVHSQHQWDATSRLQATLGADYARDSTLTTELIDAGRQTTVADRDTVTIAPGLVFRLSDVTSLNSNFLYSDVQFSGTTDQSLVNYTYKQLLVGGTHILNDQIQLSLTGFVSEFETPSLGGKTRTYGGQTGVTYQYSSDLAFDVGIGYVTSDIEFLDSFFTLVLGPPPRVVRVDQPGSTSTSGPIANASIRKTFENMRTRLDYSRSVSPSIRGSQTLDDNIIFTLDRDLTKRWIAGFRGSYNMRAAESDAVGGNIGDLNREQTTVGAYFSYQLTRQISLRTEYRYAHALIALSNQLIDSNALFFTVNYTGDPHVFGGY